ncbi:MAG: hypothetical protein HW406_1550 [Candidatus Brocadiaceae bacterium]|nr:hypothetical protein [Candidatus Brocadiaceae bacterium]
MEKHIAIDLASNISTVFIPWQALLNKLFKAFHGYKKVESVYIKPLSGGYSGAIVAAVFPQGKSPFTLKIDFLDHILREWNCCLGNGMEKRSFERFSRLLFPLKKAEIIKEMGVDNQVYSLLVYSYGIERAGNEQEISSFDDFCHTHYSEPDFLRPFFTILKDSLNQKFYHASNGATIQKRLFDIAEIEWTTLLPQMATAASFFPEWHEFIDRLPIAWAEEQQRQNPIPFTMTLCHGDLRCANVLIALARARSSALPELFLIDFGSICTFHPLTDFARLEADLIFRVALSQSDDFGETIAMIDSIIESSEIVPANWEKHAHLFIRLLYHVRKEQVQPIADLCSISNEDNLYLVYQLLVLRHATRFIRYYNKEFIHNNKRHLYMWYILRLFKNILSTRDKEFNYRLVSPFDSSALHDMSDCGVTNFFWGTRRNDLKKKMLAADQGTIWLLAHTGKSYLDDTRNSENEEYNGIFFETLKNRLQNDKNFIIQIVLLNPYSVEGSKLGIAEARGRLQGPELDDDYHRTNTELFKRFEICVLSYKRLKTLYPDKIDLRISHYSTDATILLSEEQSYIEPYLIGHLSMRYTGGERMNMPELLVSKGSKLYNVAKEQCLFLWQRGISLEEYEARKKDFIAEFMRSERLRRKMVVLHESWFAVDPIIGCPNHCDYCFLTPFRVNNKPPFIFSSAKEAYDRLQQYDLFFHQKDLITTHAQDDNRLPIPVACGNYTEMIDTTEHEMEEVPGRTSIFNNNDQLMQLITLHGEMTSIIAPIFCVITKKPINRELRDHLEMSLKKYSKLKVALFVSLSFLPPGIEKNLKKKDWAGLLKNFNIIDKINTKVGGGEWQDRRIAGIHFWRPLLKGLNDNNISDRIDMLKENKATCSVAVGLKLSKRLLQYIEGKNGIGENPKTKKPYTVDIPEALRTTGSGELFYEACKKAVITIAKPRGYPVFFNTSCALSYAFGRPDYNATFDVCQLPHLEYITLTMSKCGIPSNKYKVESNYIRIFGMFDQEKQTFIRQMLGVEVVMDSIISTHEWSGSVSQRTEGKNCRESNCPDSQRKICSQFYKKRRLVRRICG